MVITSTGVSIPNFWLGLMLVLFFSIRLSILPPAGFKPLNAGLGESLRYLILPAITLAFGQTSLIARMTRSNMLEVLRSDYIRTAKAKGLSELMVNYKHALKNAVLPVVTMAGLQFSQLIAGAVVIETVFSWPGMGLLVFESILRRDHPLLLGILFLSTVVVILANLLTDLTYRFLDPRIK